MSFQLDDVQVGGQLRVGTGICNPIKEGDYKINGSAHIEGPMVVGLGQKIKLGAVGGDPDDPGDTTGAAPANLMVTRCFNDDKDCFTPAIKRALQTEGNVRINGDDGTPQALYVNGDVTIIGNTDQTGDIEASGTITANNFVGSVSTASGKSSGAKAFDIPHPTKDGHRLRHICLEGPESAVYFRGKVRNRSVIQLPKYWKGLVDYTTITVSLTPIGAHQNVIVKRVDEDKIYLQAQGGMPINCYFHVYGTRQDIERLVVEYEGASTDDYPGDNSIYSINK